MRIACIGNSHLASLKNGWAGIKDRHCGTELVFFGQRNMGLRDLRRDGGSLVAGTEELAAALRFTSGGADRIDTDAYDAFVLYGMWLKAVFLDTSVFYSRQVIERAMHAVVDGSLSMQVLQLLTDACDKPIYVGHDPLPTEKNATGRDVGVRQYHAGTKQMNTTVFRPLGACLMTQPAQTITPQGHSDLRYLSGAVRLAISDHLEARPQPENDPYDHMNAEFGALWLETFLARVGQDQSVTP